ncbi:type II secretion system protein N [Teredinibacter purpureus]|uniref:type II secretion system protein N n=1 Tax=Teredinibacter purpureus TaxID=2731756 RepID=UPI0005F87889|nr:type II secretion system protein N [Teredinibacter purpureus]
MSATKKIVKPLVILCFVLYFLGLVLSRAPAELAASAIHNAMPKVWLTGIQGTLWKGVARGAQLDLPKSSLSLGSIQWTLSGWSLLLLKPCINFEAVDGVAVISGRACQSLSGNTTLTDINVDAPISPLSDVINLPVAGRVSLTIVSATLEETLIKTLDGRFSWQSASFNPGEGWLSLGSFGATLSESGDGKIKGHVTDIEGSLKVDIEALVSLNDWQFSGTVSPQEGTPELLVEGLPLFGEEVEPGQYHIVLSSQ